MKADPVRVCRADRTADLGRGSRAQAVAGTAVGTGSRAGMKRRCFLVAAHAVRRIAGHRRGVWTCSTPQGMTAQTGGISPCRHDIDFMGIVRHAMDGGGGYLQGAVNMQCRINENIRITVPGRIDVSMATAGRSDRRG